MHMMHLLGNLRNYPFQISNQSRSLQNTLVKNKTLVEILKGNELKTNFEQESKWRLRINTLIKNFSSN